MPLRTRLMLGLAALSGLLAVAAGAFGEHGEANAVAKDWLRTAAEYGLVHALAVYAAFALMRAGARFGEIAGWLLLAGGIAFAWSLALMALSGNQAFGLVTPVGGAAMLAGWLAMAVAALAGARGA
ncbi:MAG TPA: DUF423 domain-containing protein [Caulobacteraceae bacterium]|nr:DUF423 domain-containing protein [Caulobacteraceae bacterium]